MKIGKLLITSAVALTVANAANAQKTWTQYGNTTYGNDGRTYSQYGNTIYGNDGSTYTRYGNTIYGR